MEFTIHNIVTRGVNEAYVEIPEGVTHIGPDAFFLRSTGPNWEVIEETRPELFGQIVQGNVPQEEMFYKVKHVKLPSTLIEIGARAFTNCEHLLSVDFSKCSNLTKIGAGAFNGCIRLRHVNISRCNKLRELEEAVFKRCEKLVLFVPSNVKRFGRFCVEDVHLAATPILDTFATMTHGLFPDSEAYANSLRQHYVSYFTDNYERYADVFDAIGKLNVIWVESLERQSKIRKTGKWSDAIVIQEAQIKTRVIDLWNKISPYEIQDSDEDSWMCTEGIAEILDGGERLVTMRSYLNQPEETKLFKTILDDFGYEEPEEPAIPEDNVIQLRL